MLADSCDVAIVGAGPAGSMAARVTAEHGLSTVVFERKSQIGVPVQCGEYVPTSEEIRSLLPNSPRAHRLLKIPKKFIRNKSSRLFLFSPKFQKFEFPFSAYTINRAEFDQFLASKAAKSGAKIHLKATVLKRTSENELIVQQNGECKKIKAKVVIGADGPQSHVAKSMGVEYEDRKKNLSPCIQYVMKDVDCNPDVTEMYFSNNVAPGAYAWIIPKSPSSANIGLGYRAKYAESRVSLPTLLDRFLRSHPSIATRVKKATITSRVGGIVPVGGPLRRTFSKNAILVGDAAGHVLASNGAGIPLALCGGEIGGMSVVQHLTRGTSLAQYEESWKEEFGEELMSALRILRISDWMMTTDNRADFTMRLAGNTFLQHIIRSRLPYVLNIASAGIVKILEQL